MSEDTIGKIKCPNVRGATRWLSELCSALEEQGFECHGDRLRSIATPMKDIKTIQPEYYEKPITIKQWLCISNKALLGLGKDESVMDVKVYFRDTPPYIGGYIIGGIDQLSQKAKEQLKQEVKSFIEERMKNRKLPKEAQCQILI
jgi:hypothetical protein